MRYRLRGIHMRHITQWQQREPEGASDLHSITICGSRCSVLVRQGQETGYRAEMHLEPATGVSLEPLLRSVVAQWQARFPELSFVPSPVGFRLLPGSGADHGHESHFSLVLNAFLDYLDYGAWPEALRAHLRLRYTLLAHAQELALRQHGS
jgi:hypothetical protein